MILWSVRLSWDLHTIYIGISCIRPDYLGNLSRILSLILRLLRSLVQSLSCTAWLALPGRFVGVRSGYFQQNEIDAGELYRINYFLDKLLCSHQVKYSEHARLQFGTILEPVNSSYWVDLAAFECFDLVEKLV